jgi:GNAT superfamily N-acetyltransferase
MTKDNFIKRLFWNDHQKLYFIAETDKDIIGYLIIINNSILLLIVDEKYRHKGLGSELLRKGEQEIKTKYEKIDLVAPDCFLCGVPFDTKSSYYKWFENRGFIHDWTSFDMTVDLENFAYKEKDFSCSLDGTIFKKLGKTKDEVMSCYNGANNVEDGWGEYYLQDNIEAIIAVKDKEVIGGVIVPSFCIFDESLKDAGSFGVI